MALSTWVCGGAGLQLTPGFVSVFKSEQLEAVTPFTKKTDVFCCSAEKIEPEDEALGHEKGRKKGHITCLCPHVDLNQNFDAAGPAYVVDDQPDSLNTVPTFKTSIPSLSPTSDTATSLFPGSALVGEEQQLRESCGARGLLSYVCGEPEFDFRLLQRSLHSHLLLQDNRQQQKPRAHRVWGPLGLQFGAGVKAALLPTTSQVQSSMGLAVLGA
ncbi:hypothetical protein H920_16028 [Fukomys damarensis]|uniref:Uncharacterized protein n=1 Tax=Fukomys damarensis TaxID=885580 RepID=A0A091CWK4_FUKDA|nr:hypothetical protein H920_16028 [Fukomys damarensis]